MIHIIAAAAAAITANHIIAAANMSQGSPVGMSTILWFVALVVLLIIEGFTYALVSIWFAGGTVAALVLSLLNVNVAVQFAAFAVVSAVLLLMVRPAAKRLLPGRKARTNADRVIGQEGVVIRQIDPISGEGQVKVMGQVWSAKPEDGASVITPDSHVIITGISGVKVIVKTKPF